MAGDFAAILIRRAIIHIGHFRVESTNRLVAKAAGFSAPSARHGLELNASLRTIIYTLRRYSLWLRVDIYCQHMWAHAIKRYERNQLNARTSVRRREASMAALCTESMISASTSRSALAHATPAVQASPTYHIIIFVTAFIFC